MIELFYKAYMKNPFVTFTLWTLYSAAWQWMATGLYTKCIIWYKNTQCIIRYKNKHTVYHSIQAQWIEFCQIYTTIFIYSVIIYHFICLIHWWICFSVWHSNLISVISSHYYIYTLLQSCIMYAPKAPLNCRYTTVYNRTNQLVHRKKV